MPIPDFIKIYNMNLQAGVKRDNFKEDFEKKIFNVFDCNVKDGVIDESEAKLYQTYKKEMTEVTQEKIEELQFLQSNYNNIDKLKERYPDADISQKGGKTTVSFPKKNQCFIIASDHIIEEINGLPFFKIAVSDSKYFVSFSTALSSNLSFRCNNPFEIIEYDNFMELINGKPLRSSIDNDAEHFHIKINYDKNRKFLTYNDPILAGYLQVFLLTPVEYEKVAQNVANLNPDNIISVLDRFKEIANHSLIAEFLSKSNTELPQDKKREFIQKIFSCLEQKIPDLKNIKDKFNKELEIQLNNVFIDSSKLEEMLDKEINKMYPDSSPQTKITNSYYKGKEYDVKMNGNIILITNPQTGITTEVDIDKLCENLSGDKEYFVKVLKSLPAEVLLDMKNVFKITNSLPDKIFSALIANHYNPLSKKISFDSDKPSKETIVHELGHAMDLKNNQLMSSFWENEEYNKVYEEEMTEYTKEHDRYIWGIRTSPAYATANIYEMFAECYTLLMLGGGTIRSEKTIKEHFPKTLENVKQHIENIRGKS